MEKRTWLLNIWRKRKSRTVDVITKSGLFDESYYRESYPDVAAVQIDPLEHYVAFGAREGRNPHPLFDTAHYLAQSPNLSTTHTNPLEHFINIGAARGLDPNAYFDTSFYLDRYSDVAASGMNPLLHYIGHGAREGRSTSESFQTAFYTWRYPDVLESGMNPLEHFMRRGLFEGRIAKEDLLDGALAEEYWQLRQIEPLLPTLHQLKQLPQHLISNKAPASEAYFKLARLVDRPFSHLFLLSGQDNSDSHKLAISICQAILQDNSANEPLMLIMDNNNYRLKENLLNKNRIICLDSLASNLELSDKITILVRFIIQAAPKVVHNFDSEVGWLAFRQYQRQLSQYTQLATCLFAHKIDSDGLPCGYSIEHFNHCVDNLNWVFIYDEFFKTDLTNRFALEQSNCDKLIAVHPAMDTDSQASVRLHSLGTYL